MAETCKTEEEHESFTVLTTRRSLAMKYSDVKRTLAKRLRGGDALIMIWYVVGLMYLVLVLVPGTILIRPNPVAVGPWL